MSATTDRSHAGQLPTTTAILRRHPVASFLVLAHLGMWASLMPVIFLDGSMRLFSAVGAAVGLALPAVVVTAATQGRDGVRHLVDRTLRWRVRPVWYLVAAFAIPLVAVTLAPVMAGTTYQAITGQVAGLIWGFLPDMLLALVTVQLFEELGWAGFAQHTLQARGGALRASALLGLAFATIHLPTYFIGESLTPETAAMVAGRMVVVVPVAVLIRVLFTWMYNRSAQSVLLVAIFHASFNAAGTDAFLDRLGPPAPASMLPIAAVVVLALLVAALTKGRLGYARQREIPQAGDSIHG